MQKKFLIFIVTREQVTHNNLVIFWHNPSTSCVFSW